MGLEHFIVRRKTVHDTGGRGYVCRGPTVATVHLVLGHYAAEIMAARSAWNKDSDTAQVVRAIVQAVMSRPDDRAADVLVTCVDGDVHGASPECVGRMADTCLSLCDLPRVFSGLVLPDTDGDAAEDIFSDGPDAQTVAIVRLAQEFSCSPSSVLDWPYEALLDALDVIAAQQRQAQPSNGAPVVDPASIPGLGVSNVRGRP